MILARKGVGVAYHLAVVVDDAIQAITHVIRGADLFEAAHTQRLLQALLGLPSPAIATPACSPAPTASAWPSATGPRRSPRSARAGVSAAALRAELGFD